MSESPRIYLDNAATSWPKPDCVYGAVDAYQRASGVAVGRGATRRGAELQQTVDRCRRRAAEVLGAESPERVVFTFNGTDGLNLALHGLIGEGDHIVTSVMEHNSVLRPLRELKERLGVDVTYVGADAAGLVDPDDMVRALTPRTKLVALIHASNVTGTIQPVSDVGRAVREAGALFLVDAAQSAGHVPIDVRELQADVLACSGHKGPLGPLGTGLLYVRPGVEVRLRSLRQGGTGSRSETDKQPDELPDKYESGNHNAPGLVGLDAGLGWLFEQGLDRLRSHETLLTQRLLDGLGGVPGITLYGPPDARDRTGVVSFTIDGFDVRDAAAILDETFGIEVRAGYHCAPRAHRAIGTFDRGGTVRMSVGAFSSEADIDVAVDAVGELAGSV
jgi:cysteine desulfurase / selenocysteine lyase